MQRNARSAKSNAVRTKAPRKQTAVKRSKAANTKPTVEKEEVNRQVEEEDSDEDTTTTTTSTIPSKTQNTVTEDSDDDVDERIDEDELRAVLASFNPRGKKLEGDEDEEKSKVTSIQLTETKVPESESDYIIKDKKSETYKAPPIHYFTHLKKQFLKIEITLHKIPEKFMLVDIEDDHFTLDTTGYSKKLYLKRKYPGLVTVDKNNIKSELKKGDILTIWLRIVSMPKETFAKETKIMEARIHDKTIKFPPLIKKSIVEQAAKAEKKSAQKKRKREKEKYFEQGLDIKKKKQKTQ
jgi:hypothetical protein